MSFLPPQTFVGTAGTDIAGSGQSGNTWSRHPAFTDVVKFDNADGAYNSGTGGAVYLASLTPAVQSYRVQARFRYRTNNTGSMGPMLHLDSSSSIWYWPRVNTNTAQFQLNRSGADVQSVSISLPALDSYIDWDCTVTYPGNGTAVIAATISVGGTVIGTLNYTDLSPLAGNGNVGFAITAQGSNTTGLHVVSLQADAIGFTASPASINNNTNGVVITLAGVGQSWTSGTPGNPNFSISGPSGTTKVSQQVTGPNAATITVNTGAATGTLTITNDATGDTATVTVVAGPVRMDHANIFRTGNWKINGDGSIETVDPGAYLKGGFTGTSFVLNVDVVSRITATGVSSGNYPILAYSIDGGTWTLHQLASSDSALTLATGLASGNHTYWILYDGYQPAADQWNTPGSVKFNSIQLDAGASLLAPFGDVAVRPYHIKVYSDSTGCGYKSLSTSSPSGCSFRSSFVWTLASTRNSEVTNCSHVSQGWTVAGDGNVPALASAWDHFFFGAPCVDGTTGKFLTTYDEVYVVHGTNDGLQSVSDATVQSSAASTLLAIRGALLSTTPLRVCASLSRLKASAVQAAVLSLNDPHTKFYDDWLDLSLDANGPLGAATRGTTDRVHPIPSRGSLYGGRIGYSVAADSSAAAFPPVGAGLIIPGGCL